MGRRFGSFASIMIVTFLLFSGLFSIIGIFPVTASQSGDYTYSVSGNPAVATITGYTGAGGAITIPSTLGESQVVAIGDSAFQGKTIELIRLNQNIVIDPNLAIGSIPTNFFGDINVRLAFASAFNSGSYFMSDFGLPPAQQNALPQVFVDNNSLFNYSYNLVSSANYLKNASNLIYGGSYADTGFTINAYYRADDVVGLDALLIMKMGLESLTSTNLISGGIHVVVSSMETGAYYSCMRDGNMAITIENSTPLKSASITSVIIPDSVLTIGSGTFSSLALLKSITIGKSVTTIGNNAFDGCISLPSITIPSNVTSLGTSSLADCPYLEKILFMGDAPTCLNGWINNHNINLTINYYIGTNGFSSPQWQGVNCTAIMNPTSLPINLIMTSDSSSNTLGIISTFSGTVQSSIDNHPIAGLNISLSYSMNNGSSWMDLPSATSSVNGVFTRSWIPPATGIYLIKVSWAGDLEYRPFESTFTMAVTLSSGNDIFTVQSNSTISNLVFDSSTKDLSFTVSGVSGTSGYTKIMVSKSLVANGNDIKITLDGANMSYALSSTGSSWTLYFTYHHSSHQVVADLNSQGSTGLMSGSSLMILFVIIALAALLVVVVVLVRKKKGMIRNP